MKRTLTLSLSLVLSAGAFAQQIGASGYLTYTQSGSDYTYDIHLTNTGSTTIGTLWYAWIPGEDYLPVAPSSTQSPAGYTFTQTTSAGFGFGLRWVAPTGTLIQPGETMDGFLFTTTTTPDELAGATPFGTHPPMGTSFVYEGAPFAGQSQQIVLNPVPEPASALILAPGLVALARRRRSRG